MNIAPTTPIALQDAITTLQGSCRKLKSHEVVLKIFKAVTVVGVVGVATILTASLVFAVPFAMYGAITAGVITLVALVALPILKHIIHELHCLASYHFAKLLEQNNGLWHQEIENAFKTWGRHCTRIVELSIMSPKFFFGSTVPEFREAAAKENLNLDHLTCLERVTESEGIADLQRALQYAADLANSNPVNARNTQNRQRTIEGFERSFIRTNLWTSETLKRVIQSCPQLKTLKVINPEMSEAIKKINTVLKRNIEIE